MKNYLIVTGGAGFVGSNLIKQLLKNKKFKIISIDNYTSGSKKNHLIHPRIIYKKGNIKKIEKILLKYNKKIHTLFHFGEFSRIYQSFKKFDECYDTNSIGSKAVFKYCLNNNIKLVYSATSASLGNKGIDKNLSPYAFTKSKNLELLENLKKWFKFKFEIIYFYNVYGPNQIKEGDMATVIGIFEKLYTKGKSLTVVKPGTQTRRFTHISDTIDTCLEAWKRNRCEHYSISHKKSYSILSVAKMFGTKINYLSKRRGERYASALTNMSLKNKVNKRFGKISIKDYISNFKKKII